MQTGACTSPRRRAAAAGRWAALLPLALALATPAAAHPYPRDDTHDVGLGFLMPRDCVQYCGYDNQYCCGTGQQCYTTNGIAGCKNTAAGGGYNLYTTTWTLTETFTSTFSSLFPAATTAAAALCVPEAGSGQIACGNICCASWQYCAFEGQCSANPGAGAGVPATTTYAAPVPTTTYYSTYTTTGGSVVTTTYDPAWRVTGPAGSATTGTALGATETAGGATGSTTSSTHLSGGAIAGIVIGSLAGLALLIGICACVLVRGLWHGVLSLLGIRKNRDHDDRTTIIEEERVHRHSSAGGQHGRWYGGHAAPSVSEKKKSSGAGWLGLGAAAGTILLLLGLRRKNKDERNRPARSRSDISGSYFSGSYSSSGPSSGTRRSQHSRATRRTDPSRVSPSSRPSRQSRSRVSREPSRSRVSRAPSRR